MRSTTAFSLLAFACATTVLAIPTPDAPSIVNAVSMDNMQASGPLEVTHTADGAGDESNLAKRVVHGPKFYLWGINGWKRDVDQEASGDAQVDVKTEGIEKRVVHGPKFYLWGINGWKRDTDDKGPVWAENPKGTQWAQRADI